MQNAKQRKKVKLLKPHFNIQKIKTMKRILILGVTLAIFGIAKAQTAGGTNFGIKAGVNFQNLTGKDYNGDKLNNKLKVGFGLGANAQIPFATDFYIQPGVEFNQKGAKSNDGNTKVNLSYIDVPVSLVYKPLVGTGHVILGFGPYVGFGIGGKVKGNGGSGDVKFKNKVSTAEYASGSAYFKPIDAGANLFAGYELDNKISVQLNTQLGLTRVNPTIEGISNDRSSVKNTGFGVSLGYRL